LSSSSSSYSIFPYYEGWGCSTKISERNEKGNTAQELIKRMPQKATSPFILSASILYLNICSYFVVVYAHIGQHIRINTHINALFSQTINGHFGSPTNNAQSLLCKGKLGISKSIRPIKIGSNHRLTHASMEHGL